MSLYYAYSVHEFLGKPLLAKFRDLGRCPLCAILSALILYNCANSPAEVADRNKYSLLAKSVIFARNISYDY